MIEVEIKARVSNLSQIEKKIVDLGARFIEKLEEHDVYYQHPCRDFTKTDEALRIREISKEKIVLITYKGPKLNKVSKTRREINVNVSELEKITEIIEALGFTPVGEVNKFRSVFELNNITLTLDHVYKLGDFVELEIIVKNNAEIDDALKYIFDLGSKIGIKKEDYIRKSYLELILES